MRLHAADPQHRSCALSCPWPSVQHRLLCSDLTAVNEGFHFTFVCASQKSKCQFLVVSCTAGRVRNSCADMSSIAQGYTYLSQAVCSTLTINFIYNNSMKAVFCRFKKGAEHAETTQKHLWWEV